eukprot:Rmarinus@m.20678
MPVHEDHADTCTTLPAVASKRFPNSYAKSGRFSPSKASPSPVRKRFPQDHISRNASPTLVPRHIDTWPSSTHVRQPDKTRHPDANKPSFLLKLEQQMKAQLELLENEKEDDPERRLEVYRVLFSELIGQFPMYGHILAAVKSGYESALQASVDQTQEIDALRREIAVLEQSRAHDLQTLASRHERQTEELRGLLERALNQVEDERTRRVAMHMKIDYLQRSAKTNEDHVKWKDEENHILARGLQHYKKEAEHVKDLKAYIRDRDSLARTNALEWEEERQHHLHLIDAYIAEMATVKHDAIKLHHSNENLQDQIRNISMMYRTMVRANRGECGVSAADAEQVILQFTPRPQWDDLRDAYPEALENQPRAGPTGKRVKHLLRRFQEERVAPPRSLLEWNPEKEHDFFLGHGTDDLSIMPHMRYKGRVPKSPYTFDETMEHIRTLWRAREVATQDDVAQNRISASLSDFLRNYSMRFGTGSEAATFCYNFDMALRQFGEQDAIPAMFYQVLYRQINESAHWDLENEIRDLEIVLEKKERTYLRLKEPKKSKGKAKKSSHLADDDTVPGRASRRRSMRKDLPSPSAMKRKPLAFDHEVDGVLPMDVVLETLQNIMPPAVLKPILMEAVDSYVHEDSRPDRRDPSNQSTNPSTRPAAQTLDRSRSPSFGSSSGAQGGQGVPGGPERYRDRDGPSLPRRSITSIPRRSSMRASVTSIPEEPEIPKVESPPTVPLIRYRPMTWLTVRDSHTYFERRQEKIQKGDRLAILEEAERPLLQDFAQICLLGRALRNYALRRRQKLLLDLLGSLLTQDVDDTAEISVAKLRLLLSNLDLGSAGVNNYLLIARTDPNDPMEKVDMDMIEDHDVRHVIKRLRIGAPIYLYRDRVLYSPVIGMPGQRKREDSTVPSRPNSGEGPSRGASRPSSPAASELAGDDKENERNGDEGNDSALAQPGSDTGDRLTVDATEPIME